MKKLNPNQRLHESNVPIVAVTGSIGTGKSTILDILKSKNYKVLNADALVKEIYLNSQEIYEVLNSYNTQGLLLPDKKVNFNKLRDCFFNDTKLKEKLESIIYRELPKYFLKEIKGLKEKFIFYEVPLLFELNLEAKVDYIVVANLDQNEQVERIMKRDGSSKEMVMKIINNQLPLEKKTKYADTVLNTSDTEKLNQEISELLVKLEELFS